MAGPMGSEMDGLGDLIRQLVARAAVDNERGPAMDQPQADMNDMGSNLDPEIEMAISRALALGDEGYPESDPAMPSYNELERELGGGGSGRDPQLEQMLDGMRSDEGMEPYVGGESGRNARLEQLLNSLRDSYAQDEYIGDQPSEEERAMMASPMQRFLAPQSSTADLSNMYRPVPQMMAEGEPIDGIKFTSPDQQDEAQKMMNKGIPRGRAIELSRPGTMRHPHEIQALRGGSY